VAVFEDGNGKAYAVRVTAAGVKKVRDRLGIDLLAAVAAGYGGLDALLGDPYKVADVLYVLVGDGVPEAEFGEALYGDALDRAGEALALALIDFVPGARSRDTLRDCHAKAKALRARLVEEHAAAVDAIDPAAVAAKIIAAAKEQAEKAEKAEKAGE